MTYKVPLSFSSNKKFYVPKYQFYNSNFFTKYGTISWFPDVKPNADGVIDLKFFYPESDDITLHIEGVIEDGTYISESKTISVR